MSVVAAGAGTALVAAVVLTAPAGPGRDTTGLAAASDPLFGINMSPFSAHHTLMNNQATQALFRQWGVPMVRVLLRDTRIPTIPTPRSPS